MDMKNEKTCDEGPCDAKQPFARENYYFGKLLTAEALKSEQNYLNEKRWILNRYGIGWGVLCGLKVAPDCNNPCKLIVHPGMAIDKYGNEIFVCEPYTVDLKAACPDEEEKCDDKSKDPSKKIYITIRYKECQTHPSLVTAEDCCHLDEKYYYNRSKETFQVAISCAEPEKPKNIREECAEVLGCESDCINFLDNPASAVIKKCDPRQQWCEITLACICYIEGKKILAHQIDNSSYRKLAFSTEMLYAMIRCLANEAKQAKARRYDRRQHIPLLANTIKGLNYQNGKIATIEQDVGKYPFRLTTDGDLIWATDQKSAELIRIRRETNEVVETVIDLSCCDPEINSSWGIAFDGKYMWLSHNNAGDGRLSRVNTCDPYDCKTFCALPECSQLNECENYCAEKNDSELTTTLPPYPQEVVYHQSLLYVSHGWEQELPSAPLTRQTKDYDKTEDSCPEVTRTFVISIIDTRRCCLLKTVTIEFSDYCKPLSSITSMVSDGEKLWISYAAGFKYDKQCLVVQSIKFDPATCQCDISHPCEVRNGTKPEKLAFDGTHLWLTHEDGATKIELNSGKEIFHIEPKNRQVAIAYGGGDNIWTAEFNSGEARLNRADIHSGKYSGEIEFFKYSDESNADYWITDAQFDGIYIYVSAVYAGSGRVHRILP
jgi:hypothetical protein